MKCLIYTDNHFCSYSSIIRGRGKNYSIRLENQINSLNWVEALAEETGCEKIICLGDFFDSSSLTAEELTALTEIKWNKSIEHIFLVGNHEIGTHDSAYNSTTALSKYGMVISKPSMDCGFGYELYYLPYIIESDRKPLAEYIDNLQKEFYAGCMTTQEVKRKIILSHNDIAGIRYGQFESKNGFKLEEIDKNCSLYLNGHLHNQQQINDKILNLGNLTGQNFSEDATKYSHCVGILDTDTLKVDLINNPYAFNFYKIDILDEKAINKLDTCKDNSVLSIRSTSNIVSRLKDKLKGSDSVVTYRITTIIEHSSKEVEKSFQSVDHIAQFKQFITEHLGNSNTLNDILQEI